MNLRDLEYAVTIAELGSMARAAERCHVSQSTLSIQIRKLEETLGVELFERGGRRLSPTAAGKAVIAIAAGMLQDASRLRDVAGHFHDPDAGQLRLGVFPTLAPYFMPKALPAIMRAYPRLVPLLVEEKSPVLAEKLARGELDAVLLALPVEDARFETAHLFDDPFVLACHKTHPLAKKKQIGIDNLRDQTLLLLEDGHCLRRQALDVCQLSAARENQEFRATSLETLRQMVAANVGITLIPEIACTKVPNLVYVPFIKKERPVRDIGLVWRKGAARAELLNGLVGVLKGAAL
jgi:LysR family hydrogen peroxide-inducible transcriptional activator